jgi:hypothetical protein
VKLIVARDQHALYDYFRWGFGDASEVEVILDRRLGQRRERPAPAALPEQPRERPAPAASAPEQRRGHDRRRQPSMRGELVARGFVIAR